MGVDHRQSDMEHFWDVIERAMNPFLVDVACHTFDLFVPLRSASHVIRSAFLCPSGRRRTSCDEEKNCTVESEFVATYASRYTPQLFFVFLSIAKRW
ncbi:hypothetical protein AVEN_60699-1 [Araneus ventricosus]|uniref:Uncharacterized protein n=1 Tax=Araneus ventricosus TaxID=182803 RepID=A0A4Y2CV97_ARAVE|nr:hypothetical protein AVEN_60699-1 [Araneus ventricosus]